jgi:hypothetical protein
VLDQALVEVLRVGAGALRVALEQRSEPSVSVPSVLAGDVYPQRYACGSALARCALERDES